MGEKLTLARYLRGRGEVKALTHIEAQAFGVPYPLQPGWPARHGAIEITEGMIDDLKARILTAKESTASKARRGLEGIGWTTSTELAPIKQVIQPATLIAAERGLLQLIESWEGRARQKFECGKRTADPMGRRLVEHGAMVYYNCAAQLRTFLDGASLHSLPTQEGP
jgi:hypothetical protein